LKLAARNALAAASATLASNRGMTVPMSRCTVDFMEASAGFEPAAEVLQVALNGPPTSARVRVVFQIAGDSPPRFA